MAPMLLYRVPQLHPTTRPRKPPEHPSMRPLKPFKIWLMRLQKRLRSRLYHHPGMSQFSSSSSVFMTFPLSLRARKRRKAEIPRNAFPHVVEKVMVLLPVLCPGKVTNVSAGTSVGSGSQRITSHASRCFAVQKSLITAHVNHQFLCWMPFVSPFI
jgi:hypothetical protein